VKNYFTPNQKYQTIHQNHEFGGHFELPIAAVRSLSVLYLVDASKALLSFSFSILLVNQHDGRQIPGWTKFGRLEVFYCN
jgi:hypothetical protein